MVITTDLHKITTVDLYKVTEEGVLFHTKLHKLGYEDGKVYLSSTPLTKKFLLVGDVVKLGYMNMLLPARIIGKGDSIIANIFYAGEGKFGERSKPRVPVQKDYGFTVLIKIEGIYRTFEPVDISEGGVAVTTSDSSIVHLIMGKTLSFKIAGREELMGVSGTLRLVGVMEEGQDIKLAFEMETGDLSTAKIRLYVVNAIKRVFSLDI